MADVEFAVASGPGNPEDLRRLGLQIADLRRHQLGRRLGLVRGDMNTVLLGLTPRLGTVAADFRLRCWKVSQTGSSPCPWSGGTRGCCL
jgi:hypothetical protein